MDRPLLYCNGMQQETGQYAYPPATVEDLARRARQHEDPEDLQDLQDWHESEERKLVRGSAEDLGQAGWGVIFAESDPKTCEIRAALGDLLELRRAQASRKHDHYYQEYLGETGYISGETKQDFLERQGVGLGRADPERMPYYLLIVGGPESIPYRFQYELDIQYAVGRIHFETSEEYASYARSVVDAELAPPKPHRSAAFFAPEHEGDENTKISVEDLAGPLAALAKRPGWEIRTFLKEAATKERLCRLVGGDETPDFLFTASHGLVLRSGSPRQLTYQGALICGDSPGPHNWTGPVPASHVFSGNDVDPGSVRLGGTMAFHFACHSAGTPQWNDFEVRQRVELSDNPFVSCLPQRLLAHPRAGVLAVIAHVDTVWPCSIRWPRVGRQIQAFECALDQILNGDPVGAAMEIFAERYVELAAELSNELQEIRLGKAEDKARLASLWTACNDARNYVVLGDPAVRLARPGGAA